MPEGTVNIGTMFGGRNVDTFLGLPRCDDLGRLQPGAAILGAPCATPYASVGPYCADAPRTIRQTSARYAGALQHMDFDLGGPILASGAVPAVDCGDLPFDAADAAGNRARIRDAVGAMLEADAVPVIVGGDDSIPIPLFEAFAGRGPFTVVQVDAHIDWRDEVDGERYGLSSTMRRASEMGHVERIVQIGARGLGSARPADYRDALDWGVEFVTARELHETGVEAALAHIPEGAPVLLAFDCDALDPTTMPAVIGPAPGGLTYWQAVDIVQGVARRGRIAAFDLVEFMPARDIHGLGALTASRLLVNAIGAIVRQD